VSRLERLTPVAIWRHGTFAPATNRPFFAIDRDQTNCRDRVYELLAILMARWFLKVAGALREPFMLDRTDEMLASPAQIEDVEVDIATAAPGSELRRNGTATATAITVAAVGIGAAAFEAALLPGILLGVAAMWLPHDVRQAFSPLVKSTVRGVYRFGESTGERAKALIADIQQEVREVVAEVDAENARLQHSAG
jgi:hypothetical protein